MEIYVKIFEVIFPVFFVIGIGYYLGKKNPKFDTNFIPLTKWYDLHNSFMHSHELSYLNSSIQKISYL